MNVPIRLPDLGAGPVVLSFWHVRAGAEVFAGERLVEVLAEGITFDVSAPASGRLIEQLAYYGDALAPGQMLGVIELVRGEPGA